MAQINRQLFQHQIMYLDRKANKSIEESYEESIKTFLTGLTQIRGHWEVALEQGFT